MDDDVKVLFVEMRIPADRFTAVTTQEIEMLLADSGHDVTVHEDKLPSLFDDQLLEDRFLQLNNAAEMWGQRTEKDWGWKLEVDDRLMHLVIRSAYIDIERYKLHHLTRPRTDRSDAVKRAAYITKWICKFQPIRAEIPEKDLDPKDIYPSLVNIYFAISVACSHLKRDCNTKVILDPLIMHELTYDLLYRRIDEDHLLALFQNIIHVVKGGKLTS